MVLIQYVLNVISIKCVISRYSMNVDVFSYAHLLYSEYSLLDLAVVLAPHPKVRKLSLSVLNGNFVISVSVELWRLENGSSGVHLLSPYETGKITT